MALDYLTWWLRPGVACFLFLNVLVCAIVLASRAQQGGGRAASTPRRGLRRSASSMVLDRLRSFSYYYVSPEAEELKHVTGTGATPEHHQLAVPEPAAAMSTISIMSEDAEDETAAGVAKPMLSSDGNGTCALGGQEGRHEQEPMPSPPPPAAPAAVAVVTVAETARVAALVRGPPEDEPVTVAELVKRKHRRQDRVYAVEGKAELNARAEEFIRQFRHELKLQRLDSMLGRHT